MAGIFGAVTGGIGRKASDRFGGIDAIWADLFGGGPSKSGVSVGFDSAIKVTTVLCGTRVLAEGVAQLPLKVYREGADGSKTLAKDHPVYRLLAHRPNEWMTSFEFREMLMIHAVLQGNGYAYISRVGGRIDELIPLVPSRVKVEQGPDLDLIYKVAFDHVPGIAFSRRDILHLRGPSLDGFRGMDAVKMAREAIGLALATEETHARLHSNGTRPGGLLSTDGNLDKPARDRLKEQWAQHKEGVENAFKTIVLDNGFKWTPFAATGVDNQHIETRKFQIEEACRMLRIFPQMVGHSDKTATFASAEAFFTAHVMHSLMPWVTRSEQVYKRDLLDDDDDLIAKHTVAGLMRGSLKDQAAYFAKSLGSGGAPAWHTQDEVRGLLELNPMGGAAADLPTPTNPTVPGAAPAADGGEDGQD